MSLQRYIRQNEATERRREKILAILIIFFAILTIIWAAIIYNYQDVKCFATVWYICVILYTLKEILH